MKDKPTARCPRCDTLGPLGQPCSENACSRIAVHCIPEESAAAELASPVSKREPLIGQFIGDYLIVQSLGRGGFGKVLLGLQRPLYRLKAAIKLLDFTGATDGMARLAMEERVAEKFENEAAALASLLHPNIVRLLQYGRYADRPFMAMEFVPGRRTLQTEINRAVDAGSGLTIGTVRHILIQVLNGLEAAHIEGLIHRDIKPANIMLQSVVGDPAFVKLIDFGLAKVVAESRETSLVLGTVSYMAPEQLEGKHLGPWTDLYAVGALAFELLTGLRAFPGSDTQQIMRLKLSATHDPFDRDGLPGFLPVPVIDFLRKSLSRSPESRFRSTSEMRLELERVLSDGAIVSDMSADLRALVDSEAHLVRAGNASSSRPVIEGVAPDIALNRARASGLAVPLQTGRPGSGTLATRPRTRGVLVALGFVALAGLGALSVFLIRQGNSAPTRPSESESTSSLGSGVRGAAQDLSGRSPDPIVAAKSPERADPPQAPIAKTAPSSPRQELDPSKQVGPGSTQDSEAVLSITSVPEGAAIAIDGKEIGTTPMNFGTQTGTRLKLMLSLPGYESHSAEVEIRAPRQPFSVSLAKTPVRPAPAVRPVSPGEPAPKPKPTADPNMPARARTEPNRPPAIRPNGEPPEPVLIDED